jgi:hypothetical protein
MTKFKIMKKIIMFIGLVFMAYSCQDFNNTASFTEFVQWTDSQTSIDEDATEPITVEIQLVAPQKNSAIEITFDVEELNVTEGVNYTFPNGKTLSIPAGSSTATIAFAVIDNDVVAPGEQSVTLTLTSASGLSVGDSTSRKQSVKVFINEDDFFCPRNDLSKVITTETDVKGGVAPVSIELTATQGGCYAFNIIGGAGSSFGAPGLFYYGEIELIEDSFESQTGTIADATYTLYWLDDDTQVGAWTLEMTNGVYDLTAGTFQMDATFITGGTPVYATTLEYN